MKWKDSGEMSDPVVKTKEEYFDEEHYSPWAKRKDSKILGKLDKSSMVFVLLGLAIVTAVTALLMLILGGNGDTSNSRQLELLQTKINGLEERLGKYEAIDEKVTRIWEHAKSFEKFKDRFDRGEASMSLRMDHITMSLEKLQKQFSAVSTPSPALSAAAPPKVADPKAEQITVSGAYHTVSPGDTLYSISKRYNIEVGHLLSINDLKKDSILNIGQKLKVNSH